MRRLPIILAAPLLLASPTLLNPSSHSPRHPSNPAWAAAISQFQLDTAEGKAHPEDQSKRQDPLKREDSEKQARNPVDQIVQQLVQNVETRIATRDRRESDVSSRLVWSFAVYFLPTLIAGAREHGSSVGIFAVNLLLGWTIVFWMIALVWSIDGPFLSMMSTES